MHRETFALTTGTPPRGTDGVRRREAAAAAHPSGPLDADRHGSAPDDDRAV